MSFKILFISSWFPNKLEPTNGNFVQRHAEAVSLLHDVEVLHAIGDFNQKEKFVFDEKIINGIRTLIVYYKNSKNPLQNFLRRMKAYTLGFKKMQKPDLMHGNILQNDMFFAVFMKKKLGIPFVISEHWDIFQLSNREKLNITKRKIAEYISKNAALVLPVSFDLKNGLEEFVNENKLKVIGNVVDTDLFTPKENATYHKFRFLHVSNLVASQNVDKIILAAIELKKENFDFILEIGGDGDYTEMLNLVNEQKAANFIEVFGKISHQEVAEKMKNSDCFIIFSENETQSCVVLEALSVGLPIISSNVGALPESVSNGNGILIEKGNIEVLKKAMKNVINQNVTLNSSEDRRNFVVENFSKTVISRKFSMIYDAILKP